MLEKILKLTIVIVFAITGLILMELMTPYISGVVNYKFESSGIFGVTIATTLSGVIGVLVLSALHILDFISVSKIFTLLSSR